MSPKSAPRVPTAYRRSFSAALSASLWRPMGGASYSAEALAMAQATATSEGCFILRTRIKCIEKVFGEVILDLPAEQLGTIPMASAYAEASA